MVKGWTSLSLRDEVVTRLDAFIETNEWGFRNRAEVVSAALRQYLMTDPEEPARALLERSLRAVAATEPRTVEDLLKALLAELDASDHRRPLFRGKEGGVAHGAQAAASKGKSNSESTKRR